MTRQTRLALGIWLLWLTVAPAPGRDWLIPVAVALAYIGAHLIAGVVTKPRRIAITTTERTEP